MQVGRLTNPPAMTDDQAKFVTDAKNEFVVSIVVL